MSPTRRNVLASSAVAAIAGALLTFVEAQIKAGRTRLAARDPLKGFESFGRFRAANPRDALTVAYEELTAGLAVVSR